MTIDDESSIYVGGLPYDSTEESLRKIFDIYGAVIAVKIINDRTVGGKCYGFVTFTNPRSAIQAIKEMDGRTIDGRVVRVNEVKTRGGRSSFGRESFHRSSEKGSDRGRDREKDHDYVRDLDHDNYREWSRDRDQERERRYDQLYDNDRIRDHPINRVGVRGQNKDLENFARQHERMRDYDLERDRDAEKEIQRTPDHRKSRERDNDQATKVRDRSYSNDRGKRDRSLESSDDDQGEAARQLKISSQKLHDLQKEISQMEELAEEKKQIVLKLQEKSQKLEDSLSTAKKFTSFRKMQLSKLQKCYLQVRDCNERLKSYEQELQSLVDSTTVEVGYGDAVGTRDGILTNGGA